MYGQILPCLQKIIQTDICIQLDEHACQYRRIARIRRTFFAGKMGPKLGGASYMWIRLETLFH